MSPCAVSDMIGIWRFNDGSRVNKAEDGRVLTWYFGTGFRPMISSNEAWKTEDLLQVISIYVFTIHLPISSSSVSFCRDTLLNSAWKTGAAG